MPGKYGDTQRYASAHRPSTIAVRVRVGLPAMSETEDKAPRAEKASVRRSGARVRNIECVGTDDPLTSAQRAVSPRILGLVELVVGALHEILAVLHARLPRRHARAQGDLDRRALEREPRVLDRVADLLRRL